MIITEILERQVGFPEKLVGIKPVVKRLWCRGKLNNKIFEKTIAIVGSRRMSRYGRSVVEEIVPKLCGAGYAIVSGLMYGVDQLAHKKTLECGGMAIAVLGWGIARENDPESDRLADEIVLHGGVVLSEYPDETRGQLWTFPQRNRIVVGLSDTIIVVEAGIKSGTMSTVRWAEKMGKPVYAVPGSMFAKTSEGANYMIEVGLARPLTKQVLDEFCDQSGGNSLLKISCELSEAEKNVFNHLSVVGPSSVNELARGMGREVGEVLAILAGLEMKRVIVEERGVWGLA